MSTLPPSAAVRGPDPSRRVLFVSTVSTLKGGAERSLLELATALDVIGWTPALAAWIPGRLVEAFREHGFEAHVRRARGAQPGSPLSGATLRFPVLRPLTRVAVAASVGSMPVRDDAVWIATLLRAGGFGILHTNCDLSVLAAFSAARSCGIPYVAHVRDHWRHWFHPRIARRLRAADAVLVPSEDMVRRLEAKGIAAARVYNPVAGAELAVDPLPAERERQRRAVGVDGGFAVAMVGRLDPQKGADLAVRAVAALAREGLDIRLIIAGSGEPAYERRLRQAIAAPGLPGRVRLLGFRDDVPRWLPAMDALVMPSRGEPFGRAIVEGMLAGLPVVASDDGAGRELIAHGTTGLLVPPSDPEALAAALRRLAAHPSLARGLGRAAREDARLRFAPEAVARTVARLYDLLGAGIGVHREEEVAR